MWDERNAEDTRLLAAGDHATLLATYYEIILGRCLARLRNEADAYEVAHRVIERLIGELARGRSYTVPYSVVVNKVVDWKVVEFFSGERESTLPEDWDAGDPVDPYERLRAGLRPRGDLRAAAGAHARGARALLPPRSRGRMPSARLSAWTGTPSTSGCIRATRS